MLRAFYRQLRHMTSNTDDLFREHIQKRVGKDITPAFEEDLKQAILLIPETTSRIFSLWDVLRARSRVKEVGSYFITYMYNPKDFIPEDEVHGLFGYLDDAYLVFLVYELLTEDLIQSQVPLSDDDEKLRKKVIGYKSKIKSVIADEAIKIQQMVGEILTGEDFTFSELFVDGAKTKQKK